MVQRLLAVFISILALLLSPPVFAQETENPFATIFRELLSIPIYLLKDQLLKDQQNTSEDLPHIRNSLNKALEFGESGKKTPWENPSNGHFGEVMVFTAKFESGAPCRPYEITTVSDQNVESFEGIACRQPDGVWNLQEERPTEAKQIADEPANRCANDLEETSKELSNNPARVCGQMMSRLVCPTDEQFEIVAKDTCESGPLVRRGWKQVPYRKDYASSVPHSGPHSGNKVLITRAQHRLTQLGFEPGPGDGVAGSKTREAVKAFQRRQGLPEDGQISTSLVRKLEITAAAQAMRERSTESAESGVQRSAAAVVSETCIFRDQMAMELSRVVEQESLIGEKVNSILKSIDPITEKVKQNDLPVNQQLSSDEIAEFVKLRQELAVQQGLQFVERRKYRELQVINKMIALVDQSLRFGKTPAEKHSDYPVWKFLTSVRRDVVGDGLELAEPPSKCGVERAILALENEALAKISELDFDGVNRLTNELRAKYQMDDIIDQERLNAVDKDRWREAVTNVIMPSERTRDFIRNMGAARIALRASQIAYENDKIDVVMNDGNLDAVGTSITRRVKANEIDQATISALVLWRANDEKLSVASSQ